MGSEYAFTTHWRVRGTIEEVSDVLSKPLDLPRWWPAVYLAVEQLEEGGEAGVGAVYRLLTRGKLPYRLRWCFRVTESHRPHGFALEARGDLAGKGVWRFRQEGEFAQIRYDWRVRADKPLIRWLSPLLRPLFESNHEWAMGKGLESLERELARRHS